MEQNLKKYLWVSIIIGIGAITVAALLYAAFFAWTSYESLDSFHLSRTFSVSADGKVTAVPDIAKFTASVISEGGKDLKMIQTKNTESVNKMIEFIKRNGVDGKDIKTVNYSVTPKYPYYNCQSLLCPAPEISGYTVSQTIEIKIRDMLKTGDILGGIVRNGANSISQLSFAVDNPEKAEAEARAAAITKAKEKAVIVAKAGGFKIGKITSIYDSGPVPYYGGGFDGNGRTAGLETASAPKVEPGSEEVKVSVTVTYEIK